MGHTRPYGTLATQGNEIPTNFLIDVAFRVFQLMKEGGMEVIDCNNHVKSTINYFGPSCAVNSLIDKYNPLGKYKLQCFCDTIFIFCIFADLVSLISGDNSDHLCKICTGKVPGGKCTPADPYAGYDGAFKCLVEAGEIAFLIHTTVQEMTASSFDQRTLDIIR